jgi:hypothetical protein
MPAPAPFILPPFCPRRKPPFLAVKHPVRGAYKSKSTIQNQTASL